MSEVDAPIIVIGETEYNLTESSDEAKYYYNQIISINNQLAENAFKENQLKAALKCFEDTLREELTKDSE